MILLVVQSSCFLLTKTHATEALQSDIQDTCDVYGISVRPFFAKVVVSIPVHGSAITGG